MTRSIVGSLATSCIAFLCLSGTAISEVASEQQLAPSQMQPAPVQTLSELQKIHSELQKLQSQLSARDEAQETIKRYLEIVAATIVIVSVFGILLQIIAFRVDAGSRRRSQEENERQRVREDELSTHFMQLLDATSTAQRKVETLQEGGIKRAADTLQLINNLLGITERAAAKAAGAQYDFLSRSIENFDSECLKLVLAATKNDERDIIAKPEFIERVKVLTKQIESLDNQIITYNESVPRQFVATQEGDQAGTRADHGMMPAWNRLGLTGPCLFIRGLNHHLDQNFAAAITDWKSSITAKSPSSVKVDANYWIGYVNNTLGNFDEAAIYLDAAAGVAPEQRKTELKRLALETRFFALDLDEVPEQLLEEGKRFYESLNVYQVSRRSISSFVTTMGNISMIQRIRVAASGDEFSDSTDWFEKALKTESRSRWARFGKYQKLILSNVPLDVDAQDDVKDVIGSVNREYQNRIEDRSKVLSKITEYMCMLMLGLHKHSRMSTIAGLIEQHASNVTARTIYSQFRKQNVRKDVFLEEFAFLQKTMDLQATFRMANAKPDNSPSRVLP